MIESKVEKGLVTPDEMPREIAFLEQAREALLSATNFDEVKDIHDQAEAARVYARSAAMGLEVQNQAAEIKLRAERKAGEFLAELNLRGGNRRKRGRAPKLSLADIGISQQQSFRWQTEAVVPEDVFETYLRKCVTNQREMSSAAVMRLAKQLSEAATVEFAPTIAEVEKPISVDAENGRTYGCIYVFPPWPQVDQRNTVRGSGMREFTTQLKQLRVTSIASEKSHLHLRCPCHLVPEGLGLLRKWGFRYKSALPLVYERGAFSPYWRQGELVLLGVRGDAGFREASSIGWLEDGSTRELCEQLVQVSRGPYLEVFATVERDGWTTYPKETSP